MIQRTFQIEEETKVSESTSFPGRVSSETAIVVRWVYSFNGISFKDFGR